MLNKIFYIGYEPKTVNYILEDKSNLIVAVAKLDILKLKITNPINLFFYFLYFLRYINNKWFALLEYFIFIICFIFSFATSGVIRRYRNYIIKLFINKIQIWDLDDDTCVERIKNVDLILVNIWGILNKKIFTAPKFGSVNIHPSKLPKYIGAIPTLWALKNNEKECAVSYIYITDKGIDLGEIILQSNFIINKNDNIIDIEDRILQIIHKTINIVIRNVINKQGAAIIQHDIQPSNTPRYEVYREIKPETETSKEIINKIIGYPYVIYGEYCFIRYNSRIIYIKNIREVINKKPLFTRLNLVIKCADNIFLYAKLFFDVNIRDSLYIIFNKKNT